MPLHMGLVQQHLLAETITTTSMSPGAHSKTGAALSMHSMQLPTIPAASSAPFVAQSTINLSSIPADISAGPSSQKGKGSEHFHMSVGTGTESKRYASQGAQTKKVSNAGEVVKLKSDEVFVVHAFQPHRKEGGPQGQGAGVPDQGVCVSAPPGLAVASSGKELNRFSPVMPAGTVSQSVSRGLSRPGAVPSSQGFTVPASCVVPSLTSLSSSSTGDIARCQASTVIERKRHSPSPTPAHGNKPIPVPSSLAHAHAHAHAHIHHPSSLSRPHVLVTSAGFVQSSVNHVSTAPVAQPVVSLTRLPISSTHAEPSAVKVKQEPKAMPAVSSSHMAKSANYQPHHHHYNQQSQPAQTITSQVVESGPVVKDFVPVVGSPEPPPYHQPPLPPHINPFTFPTSGIKIHFPSGDGPSYSLTSQGKAFERTEANAFESTDVHLSSSHKSVSDLTGQRQHHQFGEEMEQHDGMPRLTMEGLMPTKVEMPCKRGAFNHVGRVKMEDGKEQLVCLSSFFLITVPVT